MNVEAIRLMVDLHCTGHMSSWAAQQLLCQEELDLYTKLLTERLNKEKS